MKNKLAIAAIVTQSLLFVAWTILSIHNAILVRADHELLIAEIQARGIIQADLNEMQYNMKEWEMRLQSVLLLVNNQIDNMDSVWVYGDRYLANETKKKRALNRKKGGK